MNSFHEPWEENMPPRNLEAFVLKPSALLWEDLDHLWIFKRSKSTRSAYATFIMYDQC